MGWKGELVCSLGWRESKPMQVHEQPLLPLTLPPHLFQSLKRWLCHALCSRLPPATALCSLFSPTPRMLPAGCVLDSYWHGSPVDQGSSRIHSSRPDCPRLAPAPSQSPSTQTSPCYCTPHPQPPFSGAFSGEQ